MPRHLLSDLVVRRAKPREKPYRMADGEGLYLFVPPSGICAWQYRYKHDGKAQTLTLGKLAVMGLAEARKRAEDARSAAADGKHLTVVKRVERARVAADTASTFANVAESWITKRRASPWSAKHAKQVRASIDNHLADLMDLPVREINARIVAPVLTRVERSAPMMHEKVRRRLYRILDHAVILGALDRNPLPQAEPEYRKDRRHYPAVTDLRGLGDILRAARASDPAKGIQRAHLLAAFTAQRIGEVVGATWGELDLKAGTWTIPRSRMKSKDANRGVHAIPLPPLLLEQVREWRKVDGEAATMVCPAPRDPKRAVTPEGVEKYYRNALGLAGKHSPHSWRSAFSTVCGEAGKSDEVIEAQLDHQVGSKTASAYDRAKRLKLRRRLLTWYERCLVEARDENDFGDAR